MHVIRQPRGETGSRPRKSAIVVNLASYRHRARHSAPEHWTQHQFPQRTATAPVFDDDYAGRMKANAAIFAITLLLITLGVWLMDGLTQTAHHVV
jgi:hypothetical protein